MPPECQLTVNDLLEIRWISHLERIAPSQMFQNLGHSIRFVVALNVSLGMFTDRKLGVALEPIKNSIRSFQKTKGLTLFNLNKRLRIQSL